MAANYFSFNKIGLHESGKKIRFPTNLYQTVAYIYETLRHLDNGHYEGFQDVLSDSQASNDNVSLVLFAVISLVGRALIGLGLRITGI